MQQMAVVQADGLRQLIMAAREGDEAAWRALVDRYTGLLRSRCQRYRLSDEDTKDVVQTTWLLALQNLRQLRSDEHLAGWLATIAERECVRVLRGMSRETAYGDMAEVNVPVAHLPGPEQPSPEREIARSWLARILPALVGQLPASQQLLFTALTATPTPQYADVARITGRPLGSIGPTRARCFARLRVLLEDHGVDAGFLN